MKSLGKSGRSKKRCSTCSKSCIQRSTQQHSSWMFMPVCRHHFFKIQVYVLVDTDRRSSAFKRPSDIVLRWSDLTNPRADFFLLLFFYKQNCNINTNVKKNCTRIKLTKHLAITEKERKRKYDFCRFFFFFFFFFFFYLFIYFFFGRHGGGGASPRLDPPLLRETFAILTWLFNGLRITPEPR